MGIKERKEKIQEERRGKILSAALDLFHDKGFENVSMRRIAEKIEYSPTTIYRDFKDKDAVLVALHSEGFGLLLARQRSVQSMADPVARLSAHGREYVAFALEHPQYYDLMFINESVAKTFCPPEGWKEGGESYQVLRKNVQECMEAGYFPGEDPDGVTFALWGVVHGIASLIIRSRLLMVPPEHVQTMIDGALHSLASMIAGTKTSITRKQQERKQ
jgi:AcrR family transcriptional regulator